MYGGPLPCSLPSQLQGGSPKRSLTLLGWGSAKCRQGPMGERGMSSGTSACLLLPETGAPVDCWLSCEARKVTVGGPFQAICWKAWYTSTRPGRLWLAWKWPQTQECRPRAGQDTERCTPLGKSHTLPDVASSSWDSDTDLYANHLPTKVRKPNQQTSLKSKQTKKIV